MGSEEFIRLQFEEYLLALLSCMKYHEDLNSFNAGETGHKSKAQLEAFNIEGDPALEFNAEFLAQWQTTPNYALFKRLTSDALLFSIVEPRHPCAGGLTIEDVQRRLSQQVAELHLDDRVREGREALNRHLSTGQKKVSAVFNSFWADIDSMREAQRKKNEEKEKATQSQRSSLERINSLPPGASDTASITSSIGTGSGSTSWFANRKAPTVDIGQAQASVSAAGQKAGAYLSSWGTWASEKRKEWQDRKASSPTSPSHSTSSSTAAAGAITSPSSPALGNTTEITAEPNDRDRDRDRGRTRSMPRYSEDSVSLSRSRSRRKRWSNILLRRDSGEFSLSPSRKDEGSVESSEGETTYPKSPLSRETTILGEDLEESTTSDTLFSAETENMSSGDKVGKVETQEAKPASTERSTKESKENSVEKHSSQPASQANGVKDTAKDAS